MYHGIKIWINLSNLIVLILLNGSVCLIWFTDGVINCIFIVFNVWPNISVTEQDYCDHEAQSPSWSLTFPDWVGSFPKSQTLWRKTHEYNLYLTHIIQNQESKLLIHSKRKRLMFSVYVCVCVLCGFSACSQKVWGYMCMLIWEASLMCCCPLESLPDEIKVQLLINEEYFSRKPCLKIHAASVTWQHTHTHTHTAHSSVTSHPVHSSCICRRSVCTCVCVCVELF